MHQATRKYAGFYLLIGTLWAATPLLAAAPATAVFLSGTAHILSASGEKSDLKKGSEVQVGDTVVSENGRVQLRFSDGGFVSLVPHSEFRVNAYSYGEKQEGLERVAMELLKGGLRTISGLIGKRNRSAYEMKTVVATIGIRGTEYTVVYGESVSGTVSAGAIAVCNAGGCLDVPVGQSYYVKDANTKPVFIDKAAELLPPQPVLGEEDQQEREAGVKVEGQVTEVASVNAKSSSKAESQSRGSDNSSNLAKHLKHDKAHDSKGKHGEHGFSIARNNGKGLDKGGKGRDEFKSLSTAGFGKSISAADFGSSQSIVMPSSGTSNNSLMDFQVGVSLGVDNSRKGGHGKGSSNLLGAVDPLSVTGDDILGASKGKDKKPKK